MIPDEELESFKTAYLVRLKSDQQFPKEFVGIFVAEGRCELLDLVDECCPAAACEYHVLPSGGIFQAGRSYRVPHLDEAHADKHDLFRGIVVSECWVDPFIREQPEGGWMALDAEEVKD